MALKVVGKIKLGEDIKFKKGQVICNKNRCNRKLIDLPKGITIDKLHGRCLCEKREIINYDKANH